MFCIGVFSEFDVWLCFIVRSTCGAYLCLLIAVIDFVF